MPTTDAKYSLKKTAFLLVVSLLIGCGGGGGGGNNAPVANAGPDRSVTTGTVVTLDGSASSDANSDPLTYAWTFTSKPGGSGATLSSASVVNPTFTADVSGSYVLTLVVNDGQVDSAPDTVTITASVANAAPVANAGPDQSVTTGTAVTLNGSASSDADGDPLTYAWTFTKPAGSSAVLSSATAANPTFTADVAGSYVLTLVVNDGQIDSAPDTVSVTAYVPNTNAPPVANAGINQSVTTGAVVTLDGSGSSDANGDPLTYFWSFASRPAGSNAFLSSATAVHPTFTPDVAGSYILSLVVNDGQVDSAPDTVTITASFPNYVGSYSGTYHNTTANLDNVVGIVITAYSTTTLTGTISTNNAASVPFSGGYIDGFLFHAVIGAVFSTTTMDGTFTSDGTNLSGTFLIDYNGFPDESGTFTVTKQ